MNVNSGSLPVRITPAEYFEKIFPSKRFLTFYYDENGEELFYSVFPQSESPLDQITRYSEDELTNLAKAISGHHKLYLAGSTEHEVKNHLLGEHAFGIKIKATKTSTTESLVARLIDQKWWRRNINKLADERREHLAQISRTLGKYANQKCCSKATMSVMRARRKKTLSYLKNKNMVVSSTLGSSAPVTFTLFDVAKAQAENRLNELYLDIKALEKIASDRSWGWMFMTLTAESKYHSNPSMGKNSFDPELNARAANISISEDWKAIRGALKERGFRPSLDYFGFRVVEVHDDGCPHWHILLFYRDGLLEIVESAVERLYRERPGEYFKKNKERIIRVGREKGSDSSASPASYIYNYLVFAVFGNFDGDVGSTTAYEYQCALRAMRARQYQLFGVKGSRGKLRALMKVKNMAGSPKNIRLLAHDTHVDKEVEDRNQKQLDARVDFFLGGADAIEFVKETVLNGFGELVEKVVEIKHKKDTIGVKISGLCEEI